MDPTIPRIRRRYTRKGCHTIVKLFEIGEEGLGHDIKQLNQWLKKENGELKIKQGKNDASSGLGDDQVDRNLLRNEITRMHLKAQMNYLLASMN